MAKRIDVKDLNVYYGSFKAVEDVSMTVEPRSVTAFIGPSGCGKSTFLRTLNRMHEVIPGGRVEGSVMLVTALSPVIGYQNAAHIAEKAIADGTTLKQAALASGKVDEALFDRAIKPLDMVGQGLAGA